MKSQFKKGGFNMKKTRKMLAGVMVGAVVLSMGAMQSVSAKGEEKLTIAMLPKFKGENYFDACKMGAEEAAEELGVTLLYDGPPQDQATNQKQVDILEGWIAQEVDAIVVSPNDPTAIAPTLKKAQKAGIKIISFDADAQEDARDIFVNQITPESAAKGLLDGVAEDLKEKGYGDSKKANIALVSSSGTDANQKAWEEAIDALLETEEYSFMQIKNRETDVYYPGTEETKVNSDLSNQSSETLVFSRKIGILILVPYVFSLVFALMSRNKGNFLFRLPRPPYQAVLRKFVSLLS